MTVQNLIDVARSGELRNLGVRNEPTAILSFMNLGLIELYKRFPLSVEEAVISLQNDKVTYKLDGTDPDVSMSGTGAFMWAVSAYEEVSLTTNEIEVVEVPINEEDNTKSINTISYNQIQIPTTITGAYISVIYVAAPKWYTEADLSDEVPVPPQMVEALLHYIGYRAHGAVDGNIQEENSTHYTRFEASCNRIIQQGMLTGDDMSMKKKFEVRGFI